MIVELRTMTGRNVATGKVVDVPQHQVFIDNRRVGFLPWKPGSRLMLTEKLGPVELEELERLIREQVPTVGDTVPVPDVPPDMLEANQGAIDDDFDA